jgi:hypothetical protein
MRSNPRDPYTLLQLLTFDLEAFGTKKNVKISERIRSTVRNKVYGDEVAELLCDCD